MKTNNERKVIKSIRKHLKEDQYTPISFKQRKLQIYENFGYTFWAKLYPNDNQKLQILVQNPNGDSEDYSMNFTTFYNTFNFH